MSAHWAMYWACATLQPPTQVDKGVEGVCDSEAGGGGREEVLHDTEGA